ncbi:hypothetical protein SLEP1_g46465 [Rubroshorea leprosula]|uniref:Aquaporin NIP7-1 n=1 Tax=Rubroshorea leprosula TaxID=152421 RepID=A0AAV5LNX5_9ROSI|nr:hypothetical protein SLEP1_g46465 [Rubroshorea leprosula]
MKMKHFFQDHTSSDTNLDNHDPKMGSSNISSDVIIMQEPSCCFPLKGMDLNPARVILAEWVGTFILMFSVCGIISSTQLSRDGAGLLEYAAAAGLSIIVIVFIIGPISGAHVNPAVTIAFATLGHFPWSRVPFYILAQSFGALLATYAGVAIYGIKSDLMATRPAQGCTTAFWAELVATFILMFLCAALARQAQYVGSVAGLVVGIAIGLAVLITGPVSGGSLNPARSLGPAIASGNYEGIWIYLTAPVIGAVVGALLYRFLYLQGPPCTASSSPDTSLLNNHSLAFGVGVIAE